MAEYSLRCGDTRRSESILRDLIAEEPDDAGAYALLSDQLSRRHEDARALEVLEETLRRPVHNAADGDLDSRLRELHKRS